MPPGSPAESPETGCSHCRKLGFEAAQRFRTMLEPLDLEPRQLAPSAPRRSAGSALFLLATGCCAGAGVSGGPTATAWLAGRALSGAIHSRARDVRGTCRRATEWRPPSFGWIAGMAEYAAMKAVLSDRPFSDPAWVFERKLDGIRCGVIRSAGDVRLVSRTGQNLTSSYPELVDELAGGPDLVADGEIVAFRGGVTSFERLQGRMQIRDPEVARRSRIAVYLYLFDLLELDGRDLRSLPVRERKRRLRAAVRWRGRIRFTPHRVGDGEALLADACRRGW